MRSLHARAAAVLVRHARKATSMIVCERSLPCTEGLIRQRSPAQDTDVIREGSVQGHSIVHLVSWLQRCLPMAGQRPHIERYHLHVGQMSYPLGSRSIICVAIYCARL